MSLSSVIGQTAASNPIVAAAVNDQSAKSALLSSMDSGDSQSGGLLGALYSQKTMVATLFDSVPQSSLGQHVDVKA